MDVLGWAVLFSLTYLFQFCEFLLVNVVGSLSGALAVTLGAYGAHGLKTKVAPEMLTVFEVCSIVFLFLSNLIFVSSQDCLSISNVSQYRFGVLPFCSSSWHPKAASLDWLCWRILLLWHRCLFRISLCSCAFQHQKTGDGHTYRWFGVNWRMGIIGDFQSTVRFQSDWPMT